jgi:hypothetical protein
MSGYAAASGKLDYPSTDTENWGEIGKSPVRIAGILAKFEPSTSRVQVSALTATLTRSFLALFLKSVEKNVIKY